MIVSNTRHMKLYFRHILFLFILKYYDLFLICPDHSSSRLWNSELHRAAARALVGCVGHRGGGEAF